MLALVATARCRVPDVDVVQPRRRRRLRRHGATPAATMCSRAAGRALSGLPVALGGLACYATILVLALRGRLAQFQRERVGSAQSWLRPRSSRRRAGLWFTLLQIFAIGSVLQLLPRDSSVWPGDCRARAVVGARPTATSNGGVAFARGLGGGDCRAARRADRPGRDRSHGPSLAAAWRAAGALLSALDCGPSHVPAQNISKSVSRHSRSRST